MTIIFNIEYRTNWGEEVKIIGSTKELGGWNENTPLPLSTTDGIRWFSSVEINIQEEQTISYYYCIYNKGVLIKKEWALFPRSLSISNNNDKTYFVEDYWRNIPEQSYFFSSAFTECMNARTFHIPAQEHFKKSIVIKASCPRLTPDYALAISGNQEVLGNWDTEKVIVLSDNIFPEWQLELDATKLTFPFEYKFVLYNLREKRVEGWEQLKNNRYLASPDIHGDNNTYVISDRYVSFDLPAWKCAGVAIPVFSLRSEESFGIGDFGDLKKMIDWAMSTNQQFVQILPINDTTITHTWTDSYPYNSISIYALHPIYANINKLGEIKDKEKAAYFADSQQKINSYSTLNYDEVDQIKWEYFKVIYKQEGQKLLDSPEYKSFFEANKEWLMPYAIFSYLRDVYKTPDFRKWPKYNTYVKSEVEKLSIPGKPDYDGIAIYYYIQYHLHCQLLEVAEYARKNGVVLKGDIPIGISRNSVEAWTEPHYFNLNGQAGAPPDDFSVNGQNWGFPTYNWDIMEEDGYQWWMKRFQKMAEYFDAYRIDHILGFFRIWEIPMNAVHGLLGQFVPSLPMSRDEIESYGLYFDEDFFLKPYIHESMLHEIFGPHVEYVKNTFIRPTDKWEIYEMRPEFDTQRKVEAYFVDKADIDSIWVRDGLYALISDVLFIRDNKEGDKFHPRISVQHDFIYRALSDEAKEAFNRLYDNYYYHRHNDFWYKQAMKKLPKLTQSTRMLVCGEDLGMIPASVKYVMDELRILSLEIQRMPKDPAKEFGIPNEYPYLSVCTISTHDMSTLRGWWKENNQQTQRYFNSALGHYGAAPMEADGEMCEEVVKQHLYGNSMLCIPSWQDWMSMDEKWRNPNVEAERINIPADPKHYWRYRMHLTLEELMKADSINNKIKELINRTGRNPGK